MSKITDREAADLLARDASGGELTAVEWSRLSVYHAHEAVRHAEDAVRWANIGLRWAWASVFFAVCAIAVALVRVLT